MAALFSRRTLLAAAAATLQASKVTRLNGVELKLALNAYSFNGPLRAGTMNLEDVVHFCAKNRVDALDATGYYFPGYPEVPTDTYIHNLKRLAFVNGVQISGTGVRNDFAIADPAARASDIQLVKNWIHVASKLGAPVIRVFSGRAQPVGHSFKQVLDWMIPAFTECAAYGKQHGVIVGLQQHHDFLKTAAETIDVIDAVNSPYFGAVLDVGSLRQGDPYAEIEKLIPYAVSWQVKEQVYFKEKETPIDLKRLKATVEKAGYRGVFPFEALAPGDPTAKIVAFLEQIRTVFSL